MDVQFTIPDIPAIKDLLDEPADGTAADEKASSKEIAPSAEAWGDAADPIEVEASAAREPMIMVAGDDDPGILDPSYEELWEGTGAMKLDIPVLDLDWGDIDDEGDDDPPYA
jgi:hypothetical protein